MYLIRYFGLVVGVLILSGCQLGKPAPEESGKLERYRSLTHLNPRTIDADPYQGQSGVDQLPASSVCAVTFQDDAYITVTYDSAQHAEDDGATVTHLSACGTCSSLQDLAVYLSRPDLTTPVRRCALLSFSASAALSCLEKLGFSQPCAKTWFYNARNTARHCAGVCTRAWLLRTPNTLPDGNLNACLSCDEEMSGQVFKRTAGRTRRNSGIESAIGRSQGEVVNLTHDY